MQNELKIVQNHHENTPLSGHLDRYLLLLNVNGHFFRVNNSAILLFTSHLTGGHFLKERICSSGSKFFPLRADPSLEEIFVHGSKQEVIKVVSLCNTVQRFT